ncbi:MAG: hypothetical protein RMK52_09450 [Chitinophagales bacterium]|nr:hypothetical protein [Chitinophagales bacterium]MDW8394450.1 hypothetical protein [Chitinophagales bacterium]
MASVFKDILELTRDWRRMLQQAQTDRNKKRGVRNVLLTETEFNTDLILEHYLGQGVAAEKIIEKLRMEHLGKALESGFDFSELKKGRISERHCGDHPMLKKYIGYDAEALMRKIYHHLGQLKLLPELYDLKDEKKVNVRLRLENLGRRYLLLLRFLSDR